MKNRGFTLLEILVALAILALVAAALARQTGQQLDQASILQQKTAARWAVENRIEELLWASGPPVSTHDERPVTVAGRKLVVTTDASTTDFPGLWRLEVAAMPEDADRAAPPLVRLVAFKGVH